MDYKSVHRLTDHVLRVPPPPEVNSAKEAITWVNWGINPEDFDMET